MDALNIVDRIDSNDIFLIVGVSFYTSISTILKQNAKNYGAKVFIINENAEENVRTFLKNNQKYITSETFEEYMKRNCY